MEITQALLEKRATSSDAEDETGVVLMPRGLKGYPETDYFNRDLSMYLDIPQYLETATAAPNTEYAGVSGYYRRRGFGSAAPAIIGTAVAGPVGGAVGTIVGSLFGGSGSPRYENGPLVSSVLNELGNNVKPLPASQVPQRKAYVAAQGPGWDDVAAVLIPALRRDVYPAGPARTLTGQEQAIIAQIGPVGVPANSAGTGGVAGSPNQPTAPIEAGLLNLAGGNTGLFLGGALVLFALLNRKPRRVAYRRNPHRRRRRRR